MSILPGCSDPALKALKDKGYNVVQLPKVDLLPTQLLVRNGKRLQRLGDLTSVFSPDPQAPVPPVSADQGGPNISGTNSADLDVGIGLNILGGLVSALGGSTLGLTLGYQRARSVQFEYVDTIENHAQVTAIDAFLAGATINPFARAVAQMLEADNVYVITSTLKARKLNVSAKDSSKSSLAVDVPVIQNAIGGNVKLTSGGQGSTVVTFEGLVPLVFGVQAVRLIFENGKYRSMKLVDSGSVGVEATAAEGGDVPVNSIFFANPEIMLGGGL